MTKKILVSMIVLSTLLSGAAASAHTNCDDQPKPATECPSGYTMMCISAGEDHWGCGKESNGLIVEISGSGSAGVGGIGTVQGSVSGDASISTKDWENPDEETTEKPKTEVTTQGDVSVDVPVKAAAKITVSGWDPAKKEIVEAQIWEQSAKDAAIKSVAVTGSKVEVVYETDARLLAVLPIKMKANITADAEGRVKVKLPWYRFLVSSKFKGAEAKLNAVFQRDESKAELLKARGSAEAQAWIFIAISDELLSLKR